jgi:hypothetical protein
LKCMIACLSRLDSFYVLHFFLHRLDILCWSRMVFSPHHVRYLGPFPNSALLHWPTI